MKFELIDRWDGETISYHNSKEEAEKARESYLAEVYDSPIEEPEKYISVQRVQPAQSELIHTLFCYGTLQQPHTQRELIGRTLDGQLCKLLSHKITLSVYDLTDGNTYPALEFEPFALTYGHAYKVTAEELAVLDDYETELYTKRQMEVISAETGEAITATVYLPADYFEHTAKTYARSLKYQKRAHEEKQAQMRADRLNNQSI